jgi:transglutaminase/protease-like cytokinesis protein 3
MSEIYIGKHRFYRHQLPMEVKEIYDIILNSLFQNRFSIPLDIGVDKNAKNQISDAVRAIRFDFPEMYYIDFTTYTIVFSGTMHIVHLKMLYTNKEFSQIKLLFDQRVNEIVDHASQKKTLIDKETAIHDLLAKYVNYDLNNKYGATAAGAIVHCNAICEGYSKAFSLLCRLCGIPCLIVYGQAKNEMHAWNMVNIGGVNTFVDVTWDSHKIGISHRYLNVSDDIILQDHIIYSSGIPKAQEIK